MRKKNKKRNERSELRKPVRAPDRKNQSRHSNREASGAVPSSPQRPLGLGAKCVSRLLCCQNLNRLADINAAHRAAGSLKLSRRQFDGAGCVAHRWKNRFKTFDRNINPALNAFVSAKRRHSSGTVSDKRLNLIEGKHLWLEAKGTLELAAVNSGISCGHHQKSSPIARFERNCFGYALRRNTESLSGKLNGCRRLLKHANALAETFLLQIQACFCKRHLLSLYRAAASGATQCPDLPPCFSISLMPSITMKRSTALHMS